MTIPLEVLRSFFFGSGMPINTCIYVRALMSSCRWFGCWNTPLIWAPVFAHNRVVCEWDVHSTLNKVPSSSRAKLRTRFQGPRYFRVRNDTKSHRENVAMKLKIQQSFQNRKPCISPKTNWGSINAILSLFLIGQRWSSFTLFSVLVQVYCIDDIFSDDFFFNGTSIHFLTFTSEYKHIPMYILYFFWSVSYRGYARIPSVLGLVILNPHMSARLAPWWPTIAGDILWGTESPCSVRQLYSYILWDSGMGRFFSIRSFFCWSRALA